jgi:hypothetical protein
MNPFEMVVLIVLIGGVVKIIQARHGIVRAGRGEMLIPRDDGEAERLRDELGRLKDRVAVLERIVTDGDRDLGLALEREIEALRAREPGAREWETRR